MTIAIGRLCTEGLIIAADTRVVMSDGATSDAVKVHTDISPTGQFVIANATGDGNAANTLIPDILDELKRDDPQTLGAVETNVRATMARWVSQHPHGAPSIQMIFGAYVDRVVSPDRRSGGGIGLYFCEPPNTMVKKEVVDDSRGYIAVGLGASITDPIFRLLFFAPDSFRTTLLQISYLMYHAKKDMASGCGGYTNAVFLKYGHRFPVWIDRACMTIAEQTGDYLDIYLRQTAWSVVAAERFASADYQKKHRDMFLAMRKVYSETSVPSLKFSYKTWRLNRGFGLRFCARRRVSGLGCGFG